MDKVKTVRLVQSGLSLELHLASGVPLTVNVSREADLAYMAELKRTDRDRYSRITDAIQKRTYKKPSEGGPTCKKQGCRALNLQPLLLRFLRAGGEITWNLI